MQSLRDDSFSALQEFELISDKSYNGIFYDLSYSPYPVVVTPSRPKVAILREQGVNGQIEMGWAFVAAGFEAVDVHMSDILCGEVSLQNFRGLAACGGFSYGDMLGAGKGWANSAPLNNTARRVHSRGVQRMPVRQPSPRNYSRERIAGQNSSPIGASVLKPVFAWLKSWTMRLPAIQSSLVV